MNKELIEALENRLELGEDKESLREEVLSAGYTDEAFEEAFFEANHRYHIRGLNEDSEVSFADTVLEKLPNVSKSRARGDLYTLNISRSNPQSDLISYLDLFKSGWKISVACLRQLSGFIISLILLATVTIIIVFALRGYIASDLFIDNTATLVTLLLFTIFGYLFIITYLSVAGFALLRSLILRQEETSFWSHFKWSWWHVIPIFILSFYIQIITQAGFVLFVIPGFIVMIYLGYAQYILAHHNTRGFDAMIRSFELVYGRFWAIVGRKLFLLAIIFVLAFTLVFILSVQPLFGVLGVLVFLASLFFVFCSAIALYESVAAARPIHVFSERDRVSLRRWLIAVVIVGLFFGIVSFFKMASNIDDGKKYQEIEKIMNVIRNTKGGKEDTTQQLFDAGVDVEKINLIISYLDNVPSTAESYREEHGSYAGVCSNEDGVNKLLRYAYDAGSNNIFCHDDRDYYIAEAELEKSNFYYCVDNIGNNAVQQYSRNGYKRCQEN